MINKGGDMKYPDSYGREQFTPSEEAEHEARIEAMAADPRDLECPNEECPGLDVDGPMYADGLPTVSRFKWDGGYVEATADTEAHFTRPDCPKCGAPGMER